MEGKQSNARTPSIRSTTAKINSIHLREKSAFVNGRNINKHRPANKLKERKNISMALLPIEATTHITTSVGMSTMGPAAKGLCPSSLQRFSWSET
ncbi:MAG: hypothetical protein ACYTAO_19460, partial [Planctomycetota bacterium]